MPRIRIFAGPNGSGKSTQYAKIEQILPPNSVGIYINPDEIAKEISDFGFVDLKRFGLEAKADEILKFFKKSELLQSANLQNLASEIRISEGKVYIPSALDNSYFASVLSDAIRHELVLAKISFTFETVMSSADKIEFMNLAKKSGYRLYLYYIGTEDPSINIYRVKQRKSLGGHNVPEEKIRSRYQRSMSLLKDAVKLTNRCYLFDNSKEGGSQWIAEITDGRDIEMKSELRPVWIQKYLLS